MPCFTRTTIQVTVQAMDPDLLKAALVSLGYQVHSNQGSLVASMADRVLSFRNGQVTIRARPGIVDLNVISRAYSRQVISQAAKRFGWQVKETGQDHFQLTRR